MSSQPQAIIDAQNESIHLDFADVNTQSEAAWAHAQGRPTAYGTIRQHHDDFLVSEILGFEPSGYGEHLFLEVEKRGVNTGWLANQLARHCGIRTRDVGYAGRKDRHATTRQWFSCWLPGREDPDWSVLQIEGTTILCSLRHTQKLKRGRHFGNRFEICVRDVPSTALRDCDDRCGRLREEGFPNYFGEQRFGLSLGNLKRADLLLQATLEADKGTESVASMRREERGLAISAARALMFNRAVSEQVDRCWHDIGEHDQAWLPGGYRYDDNPCEHQFGLIPDWFEGLKRLGIKAMRRPIKIVPHRLEWEIRQDSVMLYFELPRGTYATSLLRELFDYRVAVLS